MLTILNRKLQEELLRGRLVCGCCCGRGFSPNGTCDDVRAFALLAKAEERRIVRRAGSEALLRPISAANANVGTDCVTRHTNPDRRFASDFAAGIFGVDVLLDRRSVHSHVDHLVGHGRLVVDEGAQQNRSGSRSTEAAGIGSSDFSDQKSAFKRATSGGVNLARSSGFFHRVESV